ncbi:MAG: hypothetical protein U0791_23885 [Gemmataceae bacterium]
MTVKKSTTNAAAKKPQTNAADGPEVKPHPEVIGEKLITDIRREHEQVGLAMKKSLDHARKAGELLTSAKGKIDESELKWSYWVKNKCGITERMAANYLRIYRGWQKIEEKASEKGFEMAELTIRGALSLLKTRTRTDKPKRALTYPLLADLMEQYEIEGEPEKLVAMLKEVGINLTVGSTEQQESQLTTG